MINVGKQSLKARVLVAVVSLLMVFGNVASPLSGAYYAYAATPRTADSWLKLREAISAAQSGDTIELTKSFTAEGGTIDISDGKTVTIKAKEGSNATIYRKDGDADFPMFNVKSGGTLELGNGLTLSGKTCGAAADDRTIDMFHNDLVPGNAEPEKKTEPGGNQSGKVQSGDNYIRVTNDGEVKAYKEEYAATVEFEPNNGKLLVKINNKYVVSASREGVLKLSDDSSNAIFVTDTSGNPVTSFSQNTDYLLKDPRTYNYEPEDSHYVIIWEGGLYRNGSFANAAKWSSSNISSSGSGSTYWVVPGTTEPKFESAQAAKDSPQMQQYNNDHPQQPARWEIPDASGNIQTFKDPDERTQAEAAFAAYIAANPGQGCDGDGGCKEYSTSDFASGKEDKYRGFFIEVAANSSATLNGATLENFVTKADSVVKFASPVVAQGENARFDIKDGTIKYNNVGYTAVNSKSQESADKIKSYIENTLELSDTAGAVTYRAGAKGDITGGTITTNRADAGAIAVRGSNTEVYMTGGTITNNVGVHYGGAAYVYNGGFLGMGGGTMSNNYAWNKGGAVYVSDEKYGKTKWMQPNSTEKVGKSLFSLDGGTLTGNFAVNRGGAIYVESDGVALLSGNITNNYSRSLGGAIYVAGDGIQRMYQLYVSNGCITGNTAVKSAPELNKYLAGETLQCNIQNNWRGDKSLAGDNKDYAGYSGYGGGLWLCAFGGNATFGYDLKQPDKIVIIDGNTAETQGADIKLRPTRPGEGSGINIVGNIDADNNKWINEKTKQPIEPNKTYTGPLPIRNDRDIEGCDSALTISGNIARVGGAIAANGTVVFGPENEAYRLHTALSVKKHWGEGVEREDITLALSFKDEDGKEYPLEGYSYTLTGKPTPKDQITENTKSWEGEDWTVGFGLPLTYIASGGTVKPVFTFIDPDNGNELDPSSTNKETGVARIYELAKADKLTGAKLNANLVITETVDGAEPTQYEFTSDDVTLNTTSYKEETHTYYDKAKAEVGKVTTKAAVLNFGQNVSNTKPEEKPEIEKYVNEAVHKDITLDEVFTYDIIAYVTNDADEVTITDTLVPYLDFNGTKDTWYVQDIGPVNNHKVTNDITNKKVNDDASVSYLSPGKMNGDYPKGLGNKADKQIKNVKSDGKDTKQLYVHIGDAKPYRGHWIKVRFTAKIKEGLTINDLQKEGVYREVKGGNTINDFDKDRAEPNKGNSPVKAGADHKGVPNKAEYEIKVPNEAEAKYKDSSNTVTVKPETVTLEASKVWKNADGSAMTEWPAGAKVTFALMNGETEVETKTLSKAGTVTFTAQPKLEGVTYTVAEKSVTGIDALQDGDAKVANNTWTFTNKVKPEEPKVEKYVNDEVHADIVNFDQDFEYSVMAFVPKDAKKVVLTDTLRKDLEFVNDTPENVLTSVKIFKENDSDAKTAVGKDQLRNAATVAKNGRSGCPVTVSVDKKTVTLTLDEAFLQTANDALFKTEAKGLDGVWVKMSFKAQIKEDSYKDLVTKLTSGDDATDTGISWEKVTTNESTIDKDGVAHTEVANGGEHAGLANKAQYKVTIGNQGESTYETNTVTIKPEVTKVYAKKSWKDEKGKDAATWPDDVKSVSVKVFRSETGKEDVEVDTIVVKKDNQPAASKDLPKLKKATYSVEEVEIPGYREVGSVEGTGTEADPFVFTNQKNGGPQIEKYVNNKVHNDNNAFDTSFKYDIIAFVPEDADEIVIKDTLVNALEFAKAPENGTLTNSQTVAATKSDKPTEVVTSIVVKDSNDHTVNGTVKKEDGKDLGDAAVPTIKGQTLTVNIADVTAYRGKYIQVTFWAKYTQKMIDAAKVGDSKTINGNGAVLGGQRSHTGTTNDASYDIKVGNDWTKDVKSNTVTVKSKTTKLEAEKKWQNADGSEADWPEDVEKVEINVLNGTKVVDTIELTAEKSKNTSKDLPVLVGVEYKLDEVEVPGYTITVDGMVFTNKKQPNKPEIEKYINKDVDAHLEEFDKAFTYDIMAYVPEDADSIEITDTLVDALEFAEGPVDETKAAVASTDKAKVVSSVVAKNTNDHTANGTVASTDGTAVSGAECEIDGQTLTVKIENAKEYRGQWIQVTFAAKYTQAAINAAKVANSENVTDNGTVISEIKTHDGTANTASYKIKVGNKWSSDHKSNTVTHDAETVQVEAEKQWRNADGTAAEWPSGVNEVKINVLNSKTDATADTITLTRVAPKAKSKKLPKLIGVTYSIKEVPIRGYISRVNGNVVVNTEGEGPEVEKYVNNDVTYDFDNFDQTFEYEIMGYVTNDATEATFTDELNSVLEFVDDGNIKVYDMGTDNDHKTTVAGAGTEVTPTSAKAEGKNLTVSFDEAAITPLRGHWVKVTFEARISVEGRSAVAKKIAEKAKNNTAANNANWANIDDNDPVLIETKHDGVPNKAKLSIKTQNNGTFNLDTNTVTVEPKTVELKATKTWKNADGSAMTEWPEGAKVTFALMNGETEVETKTLSKAGTVTFTAQPKLEGVTYTVAEKSVTGIDALQDGDPAIEGNTWTFTNKVQPGPVDEKPEIEKYVNQAVHKDITLDEEFTYDVIAYVTNDASKVVIEDTLNDDLQFVSAAGDVNVADMGADDNHKVTNNISAVLVNEDATVAEAGTDIANADVSIDGRKLVVTIADATAYRGHWVKVTFVAKIADGKTIEDLSYTTIEAGNEEDRAVPNVGNDPVISDEDHTGVPNKASYKIGVMNSAGIVETKYDDESNTVTVKPDEIPVYFSKKELDGDELEGAKIVVKDEEGNVIEEWVSTKESHRIDLKPGKYSMQEVVAPDGFQRVTTTIWFEVNENGKVTLLTAEVDNGGKISIMDADHIILEDAPVKNPILSISKTSKTKNAMPGDVIDYVITIENSGDGDAEAVEVEDTMDDNLTYVSDDSDGVNDGQKVTWTVDVAAGKTKTIKIKCRVDEDATGKVINKAEITNYENEFVDNGDDEHDIVLGVYKDVDDKDDKKPESKKNSKTRSANTGDDTNVVLWGITLLLTLALVVVLRIRRRYQR